MDWGKVGGIAVALAVVLLLIAGVVASRRPGLARVQVMSDVVVVRPRGVLAVLALRSRITLPLSDIEAVYPVEDPRERYGSPGVRLPGIWLPGLLAGTFQSRSGRSFWLVGARGTSVRMDLAHRALAYLVVDVADPQGVVDDVRAALRNARH